MLVPSSRVIQSKKSPIILGLLSGSTPSFCWEVFGGGDEPVNAAVGINAIYCENTMKRTLPKFLYITAGGIYKYH